MKVLIIGRGGREHAIAYKLSESLRVSEIYVAPGNPGMKDIAKLVDIDELDMIKLVNFALEKEIDLTIVGPEIPLLNGIVDIFKQNGLKIFGPTKDAALIEGSKKFAKELMKKYDIPTSLYESFVDYQKALEYIEIVNFPIVIKYNGLAAGKGVVICNTISEAKKTLYDMLVKNKFGNEGLIIEEFLVGEEFSLMAFVNGENVYPMVIAQDHKRAFDQDFGPNTGGMGAYSPVPIIKKTVIDESLEKILKPVAKAMKKEGKSFMGILYAGLILTKEGPKVIEFNARFGDPETEVVLLRLESDLFEIIIDVMDNFEPIIKWSDFYTIGVVLASVGYPESYEKGYIIKGLEEVNDVFHMGTTYKSSNYYTNGGRVLFLYAKGKDLNEARINVYDKVKKIDSNNLFYRSDIGFRSLKNNI